MRVRAARIEDVPAVLRVERAAETAPHWAEGVYLEMLTEAAGVEPEHGVLVAEDLDGTVVGFGVVSLLRSVGSAEVENLAVAEGMRRRGAGRALCEALLVWAGERGAVEVTLEVRAGNVEARGLYGRLGFAAVGVRRGYYGGLEDAVQMRREMARG